MSKIKGHFDREKIIEEAQAFCEGISIDKRIVSENFHRLIVKSPSHEKAATINIHYNNDGTTTFATHEGENKELGNEVAGHIAGKTKFDEKYNTSIYIENLSSQDFKGLCEFLEQYCKAELVETRNQTHCTQAVYKSRYGDKLTLNHFSNGAFNVQGKSNLLKSQVIEGLSGYLTYADIVDATLKTFDITQGTKPDYEKLFDARFPRAAKLLEDKIKFIIMPCFILERCEVEAPDYSFMVFPVLRGIEGFIKQLFKDKGIIITEKDNFGTYFVKDVSTGWYGLNSDTESKFSTIFNKTVAEKLYNYYRKNRHAVFHVDGTIATTRMITDKAEAISLINESYELIENCASCLFLNDLKFLS